MSAISAYISIGNLIAEGWGLFRDHSERSRADVDEAERHAAWYRRERVWFVDVDASELIGDDTHMYSRQARRLE
jgi:hypothetical protein